MSSFGLSKVLDGVERMVEGRVLDVIRGDKTLPYDSRLGTGGSRT